MTSRSATDAPGFVRRQHEFAAHIRDPDNAPAPADIEDRRMAIYRELFYNNVEGFLANSFPVLRSLLDDTAWHALVREYFAVHRARTPLFPEMPREFLAWLETERGERPGDLPCLRELAHYEWVELALSLAEEPPAQPGVDRDGDLLAGIPVLSPLAWHLAYRFPVHRLGPGDEAVPPGEQPAFLVVYRDREDAIGFLEINAVTKRLLELIDGETGASGAELLARIAGEMRHPDPAVVARGGAEIMADLRDRDIILGTRRA